MDTRHTTAMEGGSAENAGAIFSPYILYIAAPVHPWTRGIPYILYIKKPRKAGALSITYSQTRSIVARCGTENMQQADENVEDAQIETDRHHNVVAVLIMDHATCVIQDETTHQQDNHTRDSQ